jgi:hypothetical protein
MSPGKAVSLSGSSGWKNTEEREAMRLDIYLNYRGNCEEAFRFYEQYLGGKITGIVRHAEQPNPNVGADWKAKILHARIENPPRQVKKKADLG